MKTKDFIKTTNNQYTKKLGVKPGKARYVFPPLLITKIKDVVPNLEVMGWDVLEVF